MTTKTTKTHGLSPILLILAAGTAIRATDRKSGEQIRTVTDKMLKLRGEDIQNITETTRSHTKIVAFQYKGRRATVKLRKAVRSLD